MSKYIYTVTAITKDGKDSRCLGFYLELESAKHAVNVNRCDMQECLYKYIVIEKQKEGIHTIAIPEQWYQWVGSNSLSDAPGEWIGYKMPEGERFACIVNWNQVG